MIFIKYKYKLIKKCEMDFWGLCYLRVRRQNLFIYLKKVFILNLTRYSINFGRMAQNYYKRFSKIRRFLSKKKTRKILNVMLQQHKFTNPFLKKIKKNEEKSRLRLNYYLLFGRQSLKKAMYVYRRMTRYRISRNDILIGMTFAADVRNRQFIPKQRSFFERQCIFFKKITLFYNQFNMKKLKKLGFLASKSRTGGINSFFFLLEGRIDSMILRMNLGSKFFVRHFIKARNVLVGGKSINYINYRVKENTRVTFIPSKLSYIYDLLHEKIVKRRFFTQPPYYFEINYRLLVFFIIPKFINPSFVPYPFLNSSSTIITGLHTVLWGW